MKLFHQLAHLQYFYFVGCLFSLDAEITAPQPNPPTAWLANPVAPASGVYIFSTGTSGIQTTIDALYAQNGNGFETNVSDHGQFSSNRYAIMFQPGDYTSLGLNVRVGYYTSVMGLGVAPTDTTISDVRSPPASNTLTPGSLDTFWRSAENFLTKPQLSFIPGGTAQKGMLWAVSQAAPLRRVIVHGNAANTELTGLYLFTLPTPLAPPYAGCYASGGFMADCQVFASDGTTPWKINQGSQQQWFSRNSAMGSWSNGVWNAVFVGCSGAPATTDPYVLVNNPYPGNPPPPHGNPYTTITETPIIAEKPYISFDGTHYFLNFPPLEINKIGPTTNFALATQVNFTNVYVTTDADFTSVANINSALSNGLHVVLSPGIYTLDDSIQITHNNLCILGIGFPTLIAPLNGHPCITVGSNDGVKIAGILLQAGTPQGSPTTTTTLLRWGVPNVKYARYEGNASNPGFLYDCFARVGGPADSTVDPVSASIMVQINNGNVICDNAWLWRADHDIGGEVTNGRDYCATCLQVNGNHVTTYGISCEHSWNNLMEWEGDYGAVYFFQAEFPYDAPQSHYVQYGFTGYKLSYVYTHNAYGVGLYCYLRDYSNWIPSGITVDPDCSNVQFTNAYTRFLNVGGHLAEQITHVINHDGDPVNKNACGPSYIHNWSTSTPSFTQISKQRMPH